MNTSRDRAQVCSDVEPGGDGDGAERDAVGAGGDADGEAVPDDRGCASAGSRAGGVAHPDPTRVGSARVPRVRAGAVVPWCSSEHHDDDARGRPRCAAPAAGRASGDRECDGQPGAETDAGDERQEARRSSGRAGGADPARVLLVRSPSGARCSSPRGGSPDRRTAPAVLVARVCGFPNPVRSRRVRPARSVCSRTCLTRTEPSPCRSSSRWAPSGAQPAAVRNAAAYVVLGVQPDQRRCEPVRAQRVGAGLHQPGAVAVPGRGRGRR